MVKKINIKKYILIIIAAIIFACDIYFNKNILVSSFEQCLYSVMKIEGSSTSPFIYAIIYIAIFFIIIFPILFFPSFDFALLLLLELLPLKQK